MKYLKWNHLCTKSCDQPPVCCSVIDISFMQNAVSLLDVGNLLLQLFLELNDLSEIRDYYIWNHLKDNVWAILQALIAVLGYVNSWCTLLCKINFYTDVFSGSICKFLLRKSSMRMQNPVCILNVLSVHFLGIVCYDIYLSYLLVHNLTF